jgi:hypothetical protein
MWNRSLSPIPARQGGKKMNYGRFAALCVGIVLPLILSGAASAVSGESEIKGAAILDHPCGKVAVKQMGLTHAGKMDEANKLTTKEMQEQWKAMPAKDRTMMSGMMKEMSQRGAILSRYQIQRCSRHRRPIGHLEGREEG